MDDRNRTTPLSPQTKRAQGGVGAPHLHKGGPEGNERGPRDAADPGTTRYGSGKPTGANEPPRQEAKEHNGWTSRQGGQAGRGDAAHDQEGSR